MLGEETICLNNTWEQFCLFCAQTCHAIRRLCRHNLCKFGCYTMTDLGRAVSMEVYELSEARFHALRVLGTHWLKGEVPSSAFDPYVGKRKKLWRTAADATCWLEDMRTCP